MTRSAKNQSKRSNSSSGGKALEGVKEKAVETIQRKRKRNGKKSTGGKEKHLSVRQKSTKKKKKNLIRKGLTRERLFPVVRTSATLLCTSPTAQHVYSLSARSGAVDDDVARTSLRLPRL